MVLGGCWWLTYGTGRLLVADLGYWEVVGG